jgi:hypothetical protein
LLVFVGLGVWLWKSNLFVQSRELTWQVGDDRAISSVEIQLWNEGDELVKRELFAFADGAPAELVQKIQLGEGSYRARVFIRRAAGSAEEQYAQTVRVGSEATVVLSLRGSNARR